MNLPEELKSFVLSLLDEAQITDAVIRETAQQDVSRQLEEYITLKLLETLSQADRDEYMEMCELFPASFDQYGYFKEHITDIETVIRTFLPDFKAAFLHNASA